MLLILFYGLIVMGLATLRESIRTDNKLPLDSQPISYSPARVVDLG